MNEYTVVREIVGESAFRIDHFDQSARASTQVARLVGTVRSMKHSFLSGFEDFAIISCQVTWI